MTDADNLNPNDCVIAVVIPCYRVSKKIVDVINSIGPEVSLIYCVDDACPEQTCDVVNKTFSDEKRVRLLKHEKNQGAGSAILTGYRQAVKDGAGIVVKIDGDGQMDPSYITSVIRPIVEGQADYVKGNRFFYLNSTKNMPFVRLVGNAGLSFLSKLSTGYWDLFDPTNGYTAIHSKIINELSMDKIHKSFLFEFDMLFHLSLLKAVVKEIPMPSIYGDGGSNLNPLKELFRFPLFRFRNFISRFICNYLIRNFSLASLNLLSGVILFLFGMFFGIVKWVGNLRNGVTTPAGTVMIGALPIILGFQLILSFLAYDISNVPRTAIHRNIILEV